MGKFRDGMPVKAEAVTLILSSIDRIKEILAGLEATETEPEGTDEDLIEKLHAMAEGGHHAEAEPVAAPVPVVAAPPVQPAIAPEVAKGTLVDQVLERQLRPGEVSLDDLERAFRETETEVAPHPLPSPAAPEPEAAPGRGGKGSEGRSPRRPPSPPDTDVQADKIANQSIRVNVDTLEHPMTMVSELV
jgi:two-component system chemotaxis sensor kinase CheA